VAHGKPQGDPPPGGIELADTRRPRARQAYALLSDLLDDLRGEVEDLADVLAQERGASRVETADVLGAWESVLSAGRSTLRRTPD
jgi:hypothetical protein